MVVGEGAGDGPDRGGLEDLVQGVQVEGLTAEGVVTVVAAEWHGRDAVTVTFRTASGVVDEKVVFRSQAPSLRVVPADAAGPFDGDAAAFRLAAEALRIQIAARFDPMLAVTTSDLDPLPHQIRAVYGDLLPRVPLRFLLADDPGAGKTVMAGLYIKELALRGDLARCLIVVPGGLVEQWQDELLEKFGLRFTILTNDLLKGTPPGQNPFHEYPRLIVRMDQIARSDVLLDRLADTSWDVVVVDEAHRMAAHYTGGELKTTRRYQLGRRLGRVARHLLLMTATPHTGKEEDFQLFLAMLDEDRFAGRYRKNVHISDTDGLMRRRVKEEMFTFEGKPLFPERWAYTLTYELSPGERELYDAVTGYVRTEMNRADQLKVAGESRRGNTVGFALTVLQRRLASSPEAILRSLERRRRRLAQRLSDQLAQPAGQVLHDEDLEGAVGAVDPTDADDVLAEYGAAELEELEDQVVDAATAARTAEELRLEIKALDELVVLAKQVRHASTDRKWTELRELLDNDPRMFDANGNRRKIIIFTEHRDTLDYLVHRIVRRSGLPERVAAIHGGVSREERRAIQERFQQDPDLEMLVATDAAGEGLNLQRAHLMVNYDLPWNPNRIEQRFGRIHRIGQTEVCHLWNLVATDTREGEVFQQLLDKVERQRKTLGGKVFDVLGETFEDAPLRKLLLDAIRYGDRPEVKAQLNRIIDDRVGEGLDKLLADRALHHDLLTAADVEQVRLEMEEARARRLQPHYVDAFFRAAFADLRGRIRPREPGRYEVSHVPQVLRERYNARNVLPRYERVAFDREHLRVDGLTTADLLAPGHPLLDAVVEETIARHAGVLDRGTVLVDRLDAGEVPRLLVTLRQDILDSFTPPRPVLRRFEFVELASDGTARTAGHAPYLDYQPPTEDERPLLGSLLTDPWLAQARQQTVSWAIANVLPGSLAEVQARVGASVARTRRLVTQRLKQEINYWYAEQGRLLDLVQAGKRVKLRPETAERNAREFEARLERRLAELGKEEHLQPRPPVVGATALVVPQGLLNRLAGHRDQPPEFYIRDTAETDRRAVAAVVEAERRLGHDPEVMPHNNKGYDIRSRTPDGHLVHLEVKGRVTGAETFAITRNEVLHGKNADRYRLAMVSVHPDGPAGDRVCYLLTRYEGIDLSDFAVESVILKWEEFWSRGGDPR
jgi:superfamily II DNA or RNA helicase